MKTVGEFLGILRQTENTELIALLRHAENVTTVDLTPVYAEPLSLEMLTAMRDEISGLFVFRVHGVMNDEEYDRVTHAHSAFVTEFHERAAMHGFIITDKPRCISFTEIARDRGIVQVKDSGVSLTPKGEKMMEEFFGE